MPSCAVPGCKTGYGKKYQKYTIFRIPQNNPGRFLKWKKALNRKNYEPNKNTVICERHFEESHIRRIDYRGKPTKRPHLHEWAYPTLNMLIKVSSRKHKDGTIEYTKDETADIDRVEHNYSMIHADSPMSESDDITDSEEEDKDPLAIEDKEPEVRNEVIVMLQHEVDQLKQEKVFYTEKNVKETGELKQQYMLLEQKYHVELGKLRKENAEMKNKLAIISCALRGVERVFNQDQIKRLQKINESFSDKTMIESIQFHHLCGPKPYNYLVDKGYPFPMERCMQLFKKRIKEKEPEKYEELLKAKIAVVEEFKEKLGQINAKRRVRMKEFRAQRTQEEKDCDATKRQVAKAAKIEKMIQNGTYIPPKKKIKKVTSPKKKTSKKKKENPTGSKKIIKKKQKIPAKNAEIAINVGNAENYYLGENDLGAAQNTEAMIEPEKNVDANVPVDDAELQASIDFLMDLENEASSDYIVEVDSFVNPQPQPTHVLLAVLPNDPVPKENLDKKDYFI